MLVAAGLPCLLMPVLVVLGSADLDGAARGSDRWRDPSDLAQRGEASRSDVARSLPSAPTWDSDGIASTERIETRGSTVLRDAAIGLAVGAAVGAIIGYASGDDSCEAPPNAEWAGMFYPGCLFGFTAEEKAVLGGIAFGIIGAGAGAIIGCIHDIRSQRLRLSLRTSRGRGVAATLSVRF